MDTFNLCLFILETTQIEINCIGSPSILSKCVALCIHVVDRGVAVLVGSCPRGSCLRGSCPETIIFARISYQKSFYPRAFIYPFYPILDAESRSSKVVQTAPFS